MRIRRAVVSQQDGTEVFRHEFTYDPQGRLWMEQWVIPGATDVSRIYRYYEAANHLVLVVTVLAEGVLGLVQVSSLDATGRPTERSDYNAHGQLAFRVAYAWNGSDEASARVISPTSEVSRTFRLRRAHGRLFNLDQVQGRLSAQDAGPASVAHIFEGAMLARTEIRYPGGQGLPVERRVMSYSRDSHGRLVRLASTDFPTGRITEETFEWEDGLAAIDPEEQILGRVHTYLP